MEQENGVFSQPDVLGLCEEADLEAQMFVLAQMFIRITSAPLLAIPC